MVLPTDHHWALRGWLRMHGVEAGEAGGTLIVQDLDNFLQLCSARRRLTAEEHLLVAEARSRRAEARGEIPPPLDAPATALLAKVHQLLTEVCDALRQAGVRASPFEGLGVIFGDEVLTARVCVTETSRLYALMNAAGFAGEPDNDAPPFRERAWPEG